MCDSRINLIESLVKVRDNIKITERVLFRFYMNIMEEFRIASGETFYLNNILKSFPETFHQLIKIFLVIGQCFALIPVYGITSKYATDLKFKIFDFRIVYTLFIIVSIAAIAFLNLYWMLKHNIKFDNLGPFIWFSTNTFIFCEFFRIGRKWPYLMQLWEKLELRSTTIQNKKCHRQIKKWIKITSIGIPLMSLIEHLLSIANGINTAQNCYPEKNVIEGYFLQSQPAYYSIFSYNLQSGIFLQIVNLYCTFTWNFTDSFIIIISLGLTAQFQHFNMNFRRYKGMALPDEFWGKYRIYYNILTSLLRIINQHIAIIILVSFSSNLYYICLQLFHSVTPSNSIIRSIYFWFSLFFLIGRTVLVSLCAARIHDESKKPILILYTIPTNCYKNEAKRFLDQLTNQINALSGLNFFHITRKFMLSVAGTVVTYELVLIQLQHEPATESLSCLH